VGIFNAPESQKSRTTRPGPRLIRLVEGRMRRSRGRRLQAHPGAKPACRGFLEFLRHPSLRPRALSAGLGPDAALPLPAPARLRREQGCGDRRL